MLAVLALVHLSLVQSSPKLVWNVDSHGVGAATADGIPIPRRTLLRKGQVVTLRGIVETKDEPPIEANGVVYVRVGIDTRQQLAAKGAWTVDWDTARERDSSAKLTIGYRLSDNAPAEIVKTCDVTFLDAEPITASASAQSDGTAKLKYTTFSGLTIERPRVVVGGIETAASFDAEGSALLTRSDLASPFDTVHVQLYGGVSRDGNNVGVIGAPAMQLPAVQDLAVDAAAVKLTSPTDPFETLIAVPFQTTAAVKPGTIMAMIGGKPAKGVAQDGSFGLDPRGVDPATDSDFWLTAIDAKGRRVFSKKTSLDALGLRTLRRTVEDQYVRERDRLNRLGFRFDLGAYSIKEELPLGPSVTKLTSFPDKAISFSLEKRRVDGAEVDKYFGLLTGSIEDVIGMEPLGAPLTVYLNGNTLAQRRRTPGLVLCRAKTVPFFAPGTPEGHAEIGARFFDYWNAPIIGPEVRRQITARLDGPEFARAMSFLGPHHRKVVDQIIQDVKSWIAKLMDLEQLRQSAVGSRAYNDVVSFTLRLNEAEALRLAVNRGICEVRMDLGEAPPTISVTKWAVYPASQEDVAHFTTKNAGAFPWWSQDAAEGLFP